MRNRLLAALLAVTLPGFAAAAPPPKPKLVVMIAVDQFSAELWERYRDRFTGGFRRLGGGIAYANGYQSHSGTETCPGHSTMLTGRHPSGTGIVANEWADRATGKSIYCVAVPGHAEDDPARGPQNLRVDTLGDWMKQAKPDTRVVTISGKDRAAIMLAGHHADAAYWWTDGEGFGTSPSAGPATPAVTDLAARFNDALLAKWKATPPTLWPEAVPADCTALEKPHTFGKLTMSGRIPPEFAQGVTDGADFPKSKAFQLQLRTSPYFDTMMGDYADTVIDAMKLGRGKGTDLLGLSFSTTDYIGHRYGNGGAETCVQLHQLDATLGRLFAKLDRLHIPYVVALTADHGGTDAAERTAEHGLPARRIDAKAVAQALNEELRGSLGLSQAPFVNADANELYFRPGLDPAEAAKVTPAAIAWLRRQPDVAAVFTREQIAATPRHDGDAPDLTLLQRYRESFDAERSGDLFVAFSPRASFGIPKKFGDTVAGHGSVWDHDRRVPILFWWPGARGVVPREAAETVDIAPTLAAITGTPVPKLDGHCLPRVAGNCAK